MRIISWNVNGLRSLIPKLGDKTLLGLFKHYDADIICFQETKVSSYKKLDQSVIHVPGYESFWSFCKTKQGYSGVVTYAREGITVDAKNDFNVKQFDDEGRVIMTDHGSFVLFNVYCPNGAREGRLDYKMAFYKWLQQECIDLLEKGRNVIVVGDINTAHNELDIDNPLTAKTGFTPTERAWLTAFLDRGFVDSFRELHPNVRKCSWFSPKTNPTRIPSLGWRIDYSLVSKKLFSQVKESDMFPEQWGSDHVPVLLVLETQPPVPPHPVPKLSSNYLQRQQPKISSFFQKKKSDVGASPQTTVSQTCLNSENLKKKYNIRGSYECNTV